MQWYDGELWSDSDLSSGPFNSLGLRFGASVFTTMRIYAQDVRHPRSLYTAHCDRLRHSACSFNWITPNWSSILRGCRQLQQRFRVLRITVFPDGKEWITGRALPADLSDKQEKGIAGWLAPHTYSRSLPTHKTGNYLACTLARGQAQKHAAQEAILTNAQGDWLETATGNLWGWAKGQWWSPVGSTPYNRCLPGLMRTRIEKLLAEDGQPVNQQDWSCALVAQFEAIAYSNCVVELVPIRTIIGERTTLKYNSQHPSLQTLIQKMRAQN